MKRLLLCLAFLAGCSRDDPGIPSIGLIGGPYAGHHVEVVGERRWHPGNGVYLYDIYCLDRGRTLKLRRTAMGPGAIRVWCEPLPEPVEEDGGAR